jgi:tetratricopeptide (TPR) repeat protein
MPGTNGSTCARCGAVLSADDLAGVCPNCRLGEVIDRLRAVIRLNANDTQAHADLGRVLVIQGNLEEAITEFRAAIQLKPDFAEIHRHLGDALKMQGALEEAVAASSSRCCHRNWGRSARAT